MESEVQTFAFLIFCNAQTHDAINDFQDDGADHAGVSHCGEDAGALDHDLTTDAGDITTEARATKAFGTEHTG